MNRIILSTICLYLALVAVFKSPAEFWFVLKITVCVLALLLVFAVSAGVVICALACWIMGLGRKYFPKMEVE